MSERRHSLAWRLALAVAMVCALAMSAVAVFLYRSLAAEIAYRDDIALLGRLEQVRTLLHDSDSLGALQQRPQLYQNMLGNQESVLRVRRADGSLVFEINPHGDALGDPPRIGSSQHPRRSDIRLDSGASLLAGDAVGPAGEALTVMVGKRLHEREAILASYRLRLYLAVAVGALLAWIIGLLLVRRALTPLRDMADALALIDLRNLHRRLADTAAPLELQAPLQALNGMLARLEQGFERLSQFSADLAHEIRTPLHTLLASTGQALNQPRSSDEYRELLGSNIEEYERLNRMVENLLFLARADHGQRPVHLQAIDLAHLGEELCDYFQLLADERGACLEHSLHGTLNTDLQLLQRALGNLLANAVRHARPGTTVRLSRHDDAAFVRLCVRNEGETIAPEHLPKLFDRFFRIDPARTEPGDSGGLGLAIVQSIMTLVNGKVSASSGDGVTTFTLNFPNAGTVQLDSHLDSDPSSA
ncbi:heavy metal sensor histidine kinase [Pseudomonas rhizosphaerae]|uniref:heavy metal sensor histidine kinase n=1 Tax=Pseudomonas rhizosphaerae TaxID=216142 RepID=UPI002B4A1459|nr:heavy metal sensor histidine kinase [Pseudomonas rhizosphaerae]MEB2869769.1 heavy metal sensor histidine kinase [Pseudomonas rhizosphaerae]